MADRTSAEIAAAERQAQGLPVTIDDPVAYRDLAILLGRTPAQKATKKSAA